MAYFKSIAKVSTNKKRKMKSHGTCANLTVFFLTYNVVHPLNNF